MSNRVELPFESLQLPTWLVKLLVTATFGSVNVSCDHINVMVIGVSKSDLIPIPTRRTSIKRRQNETGPD